MSLHNRHQNPLPLHIRRNDVYWYYTGSQQTMPGEDVIASLHTHTHTKNLGNTTNDTDLSLRSLTV